MSIFKDDSFMISHNGCICAISGETYQQVWFQDCVNWLRDDQTEHHTAGTVSCHSNRHSCHSNMSSCLSNRHSCHSNM